MKNKSKKNKAVSVEEIRDAIVKSLDENKGVDIAALDMEDKTDLCSYMIIASGTSNRHASSLAEKLIYMLKHSGFDVSINVEGADEGRWILIDIMDIVIHIFQQEVREFYNLEELWK